MPRQKLNLTPEERRLYNNEMARKQSKARKQKQIKEVYKDLINTVTVVFETLGWDKTDMILGPDEDMVNLAADKMVELNKYKIVFGARTGFKRKDEDE